MTGTTLEQEFEQAADLAEHCAVDGGEFADGDKRLAARLRARAALVRRMQREYHTPSTDWAKGVKAGLLQLTGPDIGQPQEGGEK